jgi:hypothetical protein
MALTPNGTQWKLPDGGGLLWIAMETMAHLPGRRRTREDYCGITRGAFKAAARVHPPASHFELLLNGELSPERGGGRGPEDREVRRRGARAPEEVGAEIDIGA